SLPSSRPGSCWTSRQRTATSSGRSRRLSSPRSQARASGSARSSDGCRCAFRSSAASPVIWRRVPPARRRSGGSRRALDVQDRCQISIQTAAEGRNHGFPHAGLSGPGPRIAGDIPSQADVGGKRMPDKELAEELLQIEEADAWFEYLEATRGQSETR